MKKDAIRLFENKKVRTIWDENVEKWYFSVVDVIGILTDSENPGTYWRVLKSRLINEGNQTVTNCNSLKMLAPDGKIVGNTRKEIEANLGRKVISPLSAKNLKQLKQ